MKHYLEWHDRPEDLIARIDSAFVSLTSHKKSDWHENGYSHYDFHAINEHYLIIDLIERQIYKQKEFFIMDIGAGTFQWAKAVAEAINKAGFTDIRVHIISLRGESADELVERKRIGQCMLYNISACKVEELIARFPGLVNKIDVIVSSWCFRHLADPVGTFAQAHDLLKPSTGFFLFDGFFMKLDDDSQEAGIGAALLMEELLMNTGGRYFTLESTSSAGRRLPVVLFQKTQSTPLELPLNYAGYEVVSSGAYQCGAGTVTAFRRLDEWKRLPADFKASFYASLTPIKSRCSSLPALTQGPAHKEFLDSLAPVVRRGEYKKAFALMSNSHHFLSLFAPKTKYPIVIELADAEARRLLTAG